MKPIGPILLAILNGRLVQIADEMDAKLYRSALNPIIAEAHDACRGLYHAQAGATLAEHDWPANLRWRDGLRGKGGDRQGQSGRKSGTGRHLSV